MSSKMNVTHNKIVGENNKNLIVELIRKSGPISRADISRLLNISKPSVSSNVKELIQSEIIMEIGLNSNSIGRKSTLLIFNSAKAYVIGVDIGNFKIRIGLSDLSGNIIGINEAELVLDIDGQELLREIDKNMQNLLMKSKVSKDDVLSLCIGLPGITDTLRKKNLLTPFIKDWEDIDLRKYFSETYASTIILENNINLAALGEQWKSAEKLREHNCIVYINFGIGIGAGIIINNELFSGKNNSAGEISFCNFKDLPIGGRFENSGSFEKLISSRHILERYNALKNDAGQSLSNLSNSISVIFDRYDHGEHEAVLVIKEVLEQILMLLISVSAILNPELIIFGGGMGERLTTYFNYFLEGMERSVPFPPKLMNAKCGALSGVYGAVSIALREVNSDYKNLRMS